MNAVVNLKPVCITAPVLSITQADRLFPLDESGEIKPATETAIAFGAEAIQKLLGSDVGEIIVGQQNLLKCGEASTEEDNAWDALALCRIGTIDYSVGPVTTVRVLFLTQV